MSSLFRPEVFKHKTTSRFSAVLVPTPLSLWFLSCLILIFLGLIAAYLWWGHYTRKVTVVGYLLPNKGLVRLYAPQQGIVTVRKVKQGDWVHPGQALLVISTQRSATNVADVNTALIRAAQSSQAAVRAQIAQNQALGTSQENALKADTANLQSERVEERAQLGTQKQLLVLLDERRKKYESLRSTGLIPEVDIKNAEQAWLTQLAKVQSLEQSITELSGQMQAGRFKLTQIGLDTQNQLAQYQQALSQVQQQLTQYQAGDSFVLKAPVGGTVAAMLAKPGETVSPQVPLVTLLPTGEKLEARLLIPATAMGFVKIGQKVRLRYDAFPYQNFGVYQGRIAQVSDIVFTPSELPVPLQVGESVYPVEVALASQNVMAYGHPVPLEPGMSLSADVLLDRERLIQWIFEPIYSLKGKL